MPHVFVRGSLVCALAVVLAACGDKTGELPSVTATPVEKTVEATQPTAPATIETMLAQGGGGLQGVDTGPLEALELGMSCSLDSVNGIAPGSEPVVHGDMLRISGWFQHKPGTSDNVIAVLRGGTGYAFPMTKGAERADIATAIGTADAIADITGSVSTADIEPGEYAVYFVRGGSEVAKCVADKKIVIQ